MALQYDVSEYTNTPISTPFWTFEVSFFNTDDSQAVYQLKWEEGQEYITATTLAYVRQK